MTRFNSSLDGRYWLRRSLPRTACKRLQVHAIKDIVTV